VPADASPSLRIAVALVIVGLVLAAVVYRAAVDGLERRVPDGAMSIEDAASAIGCVDRQDLPDLTGPMRAGPATDGIRCRVVDTWLDLFQAGVIGTGGGLDERDALGLDDDIAPHDVGCDAEVNIGRGLIVVTTDERTRDLVQRVLGLTSTPMRYPPASYEVPCDA
jgi:hypothetical protein